MDPSPLRVLLIEEDENACVLIRNLLAPAAAPKHELEWVSSYDEFRVARNLGREHDIYILDCLLGAHDGLEILREMKREGCRTPIIFLTNTGNHEIEMEAMQAGAADYLSKDELTTRIIDRSIRTALAHKQTEEALLANEREFRILFEQAPLGYQSLDEEGRFINVNPAWLNFFEYSKEEVVDRWFGDFMTTRSQELLPEQFASLMKWGEVRGAEFEMIRKNGSHVIVAVHGSVRRDERGKFIQSHCIIHDITERRRTADALRESRQMLQTILNTIPVGVFWKDLDSNYLGCNHMFVVDSGFESPEAIIGKNDFDMVWKDQAERFRLDDLEVMKTGEPKLGYEEQLSTTGGEMMWVQTNKVPLRDTEGRIKGILGTYEDITDRKQTENKLKESQQRLANIINFHCCPVKE